MRMELAQHTIDANESESKARWSCIAGLLALRRSRSGDGAAGHVISIIV